MEAHIKIENKEIQWHKKLSKCSEFHKKEEIYHKLKVEFIKNYNLLEETHGKNSTTSKNEKFFSASSDGFDISHIFGCSGIFDT